MRRLGRAMLLAGAVGLGLAGCQRERQQARTPIVQVQNNQGTVLPSAQPGATPTAPPVANLLTNGDFRANWTTGWTRKPGDPINGQSITEVIDSPDAASGKAARLVHDGESTLGLSQFIKLESPDMVFAARVHPRATTPCKGILAHCTGLSGVVLEFFGGEAPEGKPLAMVFFANYGTDGALYPASSQTVRHISLSPRWQDIDFHVRRDVENSLPAVDPASIKGLRISLFAGSSAHCGPGDCLAELEAADIILAPAP